MNSPDLVADASASPRRKGAALVVSGWFGESRLSEFRADDDGRADFVLNLMRRLQQEGFDVVTDPSQFDDRAPSSIEIHIEAQRPRSRAPRYLLLIEDRHIRPQNFFVSWPGYRLTFSWDDDIVQRRGAVKYRFPAHVSPGPVGDYERRDIFASIVAANKAQAVWTPDDLYRERRRTLAWYQRNAPEDLWLFGPGWNMPDHLPGLAAKALFKVAKRMKLFQRRTRTCWHGVAPVKRDVLLRSKFNICYENTSGCKGYISEKLFDALSTGAVPIYWGAPNVEQYIPNNCFIDRRQFRDNADMHAFLRSVTPNRHAEYQEAMRAFCADRAAPFGIEAFAEIVAGRIVKDVVAGT